jgi:hypothetical protein
MRNPLFIQSFNINLILTMLLSSLKIQGERKHNWKQKYASLCHYTYIPHSSKFTLRRKLFIFWEWTSSWEHKNSKYHASAQHKLILKWFTENLGRQVMELNHTKKSYTYSYPVLSNWSYCHSAWCWVIHRRHILI